MKSLLNIIYGDRAIWFTVCVLALLSMLAVYSSTGTLAFRLQEGNTEHYLFKHSLIIAISFVAMWLAHRVNYVYYSRFAQIAFWIAVPLLVLTLFNGSDYNQAKRWVNIPFIDLTFQPSGFAKLALIMYTARMLNKREEYLNDFKKGVVPILIPIGLVCLLIVFNDLSTALLLLVTCFVLMFIGKVKIKHLLATAAISIAGLLFVIGIEQYTPVEGRSSTWENRVSDFIYNSGDNYQIDQSKIAIANGGLVRLAPGKSVQSDFLPQSYTDFIYAIIVEEYGLIGGIAVLMLYLFFLYRCIAIPQEKYGTFGTLLSTGLAFSLVLQALTNMAVTVNLLPVTGLTLPLISMGGTSMLFTSISVGIILSVTATSPEAAAEAIKKFDSVRPLSSNKKKNSLLTPLKKRILKWLEQALQD